MLLTRLARAVYLRSSVDLVGINLRNMVVLAYLRDQITEHDITDGDRPAPA